MTTRRVVAWGVLLVLGTVATTALADVKLPLVFSDHAVLQRNMAVPVYGQAAPNEKVTVAFRDQRKSTQAGADGAWLVKLDPLKAGGPDTLTVTGNNTVTLSDVLVGEVWVGSGQSNMAGGVGGYAKADEVLAKLAARDYPKLRLNNRGGAWRTADEKNIAGFSALLFAFGVRVHEELDVPVGLMLGAVGGTPSGYWFTADMLKADTAAEAAIAKAAATYDHAARLKKYESDLAGWEKAAAVAKQKNEKEPRKPDLPLKPGECRGKIGNLYEANIKGMVGYGIAGVLWDQGESGTAIEGLDQYYAMGALIRGWRRAWGQGEFPFIHVQKPSGGGPAWDAADPVTSKGETFMPLPPQVPQDGKYREVHIKISAYPNTALAISSDLGPGIHPINKSGYGARAARVAMGLVYGKKIEYYGPTYKSHAVEGNQVRIRFDHVGQGMAFKHGDKLQGFAVAGDDKVFHWADATIDGESVVVSSAKVAKPVAVRYAWSQTHRWANLFNKDGLPALAFRTDEW